MIFCDLSVQIHVSNIPFMVQIQNCIYIGQIRPQNIQISTVEFFFQHPSINYLHDENIWLGLPDQRRTAVQADLLGVKIRNMPCIVVIILLPVLEKSEIRNLQKVAYFVTNLATERISMPNMIRTTISSLGRIISWLVGDTT